jgi:hypothetical protein
MRNPTSKIRCTNSLQVQQLKQTRAVSKAMICASDRLDHESVRLCELSRFSTTTGVSFNLDILVGIK